MSYPSRGGVAVLDMKDDHLEMGVAPSAGGRGGNRGNGKPEGLPSSLNANNDDATEDSLAEEAAGRAAEPVGIVPAEKDGEEEPMILRSPEQEMWYYVGLGDKERVRQLVAQGADVNASDLNPQVDSVQERQTQNEYEAWERTETLYPKLTGNYALHIAADHDNVEMISFLFYLGAKMENRNRIGSTALHRAAAKGHCDAVEELVKLGADVHARNKIGNTALHIAAIIGHLPMLKLLIKLDAGKGLRAPNKVAMTPIEYTQRQSAERAYLLSIDPSLREFLNESEDGDDAASTTTAGTASMVDDEKRDA